MSPAEELLAVIADEEALPPERLPSAFGALDPIPVEQMIGGWRGGGFERESDAARMLERLGWHGKRFHDPERVEPLICRREDGELYAYEKLGAARLREVAHEGVTSAAMIYDTQPIIDYFRRLDEHTVCGLMDVKGQPAGFYFWLRRE